MFLLADDVPSPTPPPEVSADDSEQTRAAQTPDSGEAAASTTPDSGEAAATTPDSENAVVATPDSGAAAAAAVATTTDSGDAEAATSHDTSSTCQQRALVILENVAALARSHRAREEKARSAKKEEEFRCI